MKLSIANIFLQTVFSGMVEGKMRGYHSLSFIVKIYTIVFFGTVSNLLDLIVWEFSIFWQNISKSLMWMSTVS